MADATDDKQQAEQKAADRAARKKRGRARGMEGPWRKKESFSNQTKPSSAEAYGAQRLVSKPLARIR